MRMSAFRLTRHPSYPPPVDAASGNGCRGFRGSFCPLCVLVLEVVADLSCYYKESIRLQQWLEASISETAMLVYTVGSDVRELPSFYTFLKWKNDGKIVSRCRCIARPCPITEYKCRRFSCLVKQNRRLPVAELTAKLNAGQSTGVPERTVYRVLLDMGLRSR